MASSAPHRKILIIEDEPSIRNVLYTLTARLGIDGEVACTERQALDLLQRDRFDAVLLDLRCADVQPEEVVPSIHSLQPALVGRVLVITGEVVDFRTMELIEKYFLLQTKDRVEDLAGKLRALLALAPSAGSAT